MLRGCTAFNMNLLWSYTHPSLMLPGLVNEDIGLLASKFPSRPGYLESADGGRNSEFPRLWAVLLLFEYTPEREPQITSVNLLHQTFWASTSTSGPTSSLRSLQQRLDDVYNSYNRVGVNIRIIRNFNCNVFHFNAKLHVAKFSKHQKFRKCCNAFHSHIFCCQRSTASSCGN